ncbi:hypothetical protein KIK06_22365 [Nocardiopsis sp. EMB25]|uniref:hypothetical protein n=1 Tax=Nocardiopsis sp. EMB25 TaxID=2835867 RepID=UPI002284F49D|nr:hypothetical protein [Nocardiopsis sp. EMB25]MCY9786634.1 hypothetical protein [Nocardiopsis sp. EMB25]
MTDRSSRPDDSSTSSPPPPGIAWSLVLGLASLALLRPLMVVTGLMEAWAWGVRPQLLLPVVTTAVWILSVLAARAPRPLPTLVCAGLLHGVFSIALGAVPTPVLSGSLQGPLAHTAAFLGTLTVNTGWGTSAGLVALGLDRLLRLRAD